MFQVISQNMKTLIIILIIASFLQTTILPWNLVLIILICRSYLRISKSNLYLAITFGLLVSHLRLVNLGFDSLTYLFAVQTTQILSRIRLAGNSLLIMPLIFILITLSQTINSVFLHQSLDLFPKVLVETLISLPMLYALRIWEERFIVREDIKLKI